MKKNISFLVGVSLILFLSLSFISAEGSEDYVPPEGYYPIDQYHFEYTKEESSVGTGDCPGTVDRYYNTEMHFTRYSNGGFEPEDSFWQGEGTIFSDGSNSNSCNLGCLGGGSTWSISDGTVACNELEGCTQTVFETGTSTDCDDKTTINPPNTKNYDLDDPMSAVGLTTGGSITRCVMHDPDRPVEIKTVTSNCKDHYTSTLTAEANLYGGTWACTYSKSTLYKRGYCETESNYEGEGIPSDDYTCNFYETRYEDSTKYADISKYIPGAANDNRHNIDEDGDSMYEECCDTYSTSGDGLGTPEEPGNYIRDIGVIEEKPGLDTCEFDMGPEDRKESCNVCDSFASVSEQEKRCGEGMLCCNGECYNPEEERCCPLTGGSRNQGTFRDCSKECTIPSKFRADEYQPYLKCCWPTDTTNFVAWN